MKNKIFQIIFIVLMSPVMAQTTIPLYSGTIPNSKPSPNKEKTEQRDGITIVSSITVPTLTLFQPAKIKANGTAIIICPGGGYWVNASGHEGKDVAEAFNEMGVTVFVLKYRIPNDSSMKVKEIGPLQDAQQAIKIVRERAKEWKVDPNRIGIMGFSAGGHLASTAGTHFKTSSIPNDKNINLRPDFMILIYPVISLHQDVGHMGSRDQLLGKQPSRKKIQLYSNELHVAHDTPPTFLVHASNDDAVKSENSIVFYTALIKNNVPAEMHIYQKGGHGFGMINETTDERWMERCANWMKSNGWL
jgi:acetyl esterase/lipase